MRRVGRMVERGGWKCRLDEGVGVVHLGDACGIPLEWFSAGG